MKDALADHDCNLVNLLKRARSVNLKLNKKNLRLRLDRVTYIGQLFTSEGLKPDPMKVELIANVPRPSDKKAVQRFLVLLGCINYLSTFMPKLSEESESVHKFIERDVTFMSTERSI